MPDFQKEFPNAARYLKQRYPDKEPLSSFWHWAIFSTFCPAMYRNNQAAIAINRWIDPCFRLDQRTRNLSLRGPLFLVSQFISANRCRSFRTFFPIKYSFID